MFEVLLVLHIEAYVEIYLYDACGAALSPIRHKSAELIEHERAGQGRANLILSYVLKYVPEICIYICSCFMELANCQVAFPASCNIRY